ncbi:MAG: NAD(P)H-dependent oxidoreductase [Bacteroidetes bacterium]|nr:NAD(P)H-dependent oxidoreductase [Bacteroidota bacterium]
MDSIKIVGISGSLRTGSFTKMAVDIALQGAKENGAQTELIDLKEYELVSCDGREDVDSYPADVQKMRTQVKEARGIILGTPEYHGNMSGVLKNALDLMGWDEFEGKMVGLVGVAGGSVGAMNSLLSLREVGRSLHCWVIPKQVSIANAYEMFNDDGSLKDEKLNERVKQVGDHVAKYAHLHMLGKSAEFLKAWEREIENPGAESYQQD